MLTPRKPAGCGWRAALAATLLCSGLSSQAQSNIGDGLVAVWGFDGNLLDTVADNHGTARGSNPIPFVDGKAGFGKAIKLDGNNQFVEITGGNEDNLEFPGGSMSIAAWFKVDAFDTEWQALIAKGEGNNWRIARRTTENGVAYAGGIGDTPTGVDVNDGQWHHIVAVTDATGTEFGAAVYIDGVLDTTTSGTPALASNAQPVMIGENPEARNREWEGEIDDVGIWNRVLTPEEVAHIYNSGTGRPLINFAPTKIEILGTGAAALLGRDLTDPENDGLDALGAATDPSWNWAGITSSHEPDFEGGENAFNIFDNKVGGGNDKWCCDDPTEEAPVWVAVEFREPVSLTRFTVTSGNDTPLRDPTHWAIQGSNDGNTYTDIYRFQGSQTLWTERNQVIRFSLPIAAPPYRFVRYIAWETPDALHQLNEIEYFTGTQAYFSSVSGGLKSFVFQSNDQGSSVVDPATATLVLDGAPAALTYEKTGDVAVFTHTYPAPFVPGSTHTFTITVQDTAGSTITQTSSFTLPLPTLPTANLPSGAIVNKAWKMRHIFGVVDADGVPQQITDIPTALAAIQGAGTPATFQGAFYDTTSEVINYPEAGGFFGSGLPYPDDVLGDGSWTGEDFVQFSVGHIEIPEAGLYTFGVHSDDGFAYRIRGGEVVSVSGNGSLDPVDPEAVIHPANTGDSNTRAVFNLKKGVYRVEFFWWERGGGDNGEFYAAKGAYVNDADTDQWRLVGDTTPSQTFARPGLDANGITAISSDPGGDTLAVLADGLAELEANGGGAKTYDYALIGDPDSNAGVLPFPKDTVGVAEDNFAVKLTGTLVVPTTGDYEIGFDSDDGGWLRMPGQTFQEIVKNATGLSYIDPADTVTCDALTGQSLTSVKVRLTAGNHPIEAGFFEQGGGAFIRVFGAGFGSPMLPVLTKGAAGTVTTPFAIQLTDKPVGIIEDTPPTLTVSRAGGNLTIAWAPAGGTLESSPTVGAGAVWTAVGTDNPATVAIGTGNLYLRVRR